MSKFVLIGGVPRSGTNLARRIIGSHSKIAIPPGEFQFFRQYVKGKSVAQILANKRLKLWNIDLSDLRSGLQRSLPPLRRPCAPERAPSLCDRINHLLRGGCVDLRERVCAAGYLRA